jgi:hypothetical protein
MSKFLGTLREVAHDSWLAGGWLVVERAPAFNTLCKPRTFTSEAVANGFLEGWAARHNAAEVAIAVERLGAVPAAA